MVLQVVRGRRNENDGIVRHRTANSTQTLLGKRGQTALTAFEEPPDERVQLRFVAAPTPHAVRIPDDIRAGIELELVEAVVAVAVMA